MCECMDIWLKLLHQPINPSTNTRKIIKLYVDICGCEYSCVNVNVADFVSTNDNENVAGCVDVHKKIFYIY